MVFGEVTLPAITRLAPYDPVPDRLRGFAREYVESLDTHLIDPDDAQANRSLAVAAEGLGLGRHERNRATRNDFIDAVLDGLAGRSYHRSTRMLRSDKCWILVESSHSELAMSQKVRVVRAGLDASRAAI